MGGQAERYVAPSALIALPTDPLSNPLARAGRQLFEQGAVTLESEAAFGDEGDVSLDISQYERRAPEDQEDDEDAGAVAERLQLADLSDDE